jgi:hypothetical protein
MNSSDVSVEILSQKTHRFYPDRRDKNGDGYQSCWCNGFCTGRSGINQARPGHATQAANLRHSAAQRQHASVHRWHDSAS